MFTSYTYIKTNYFLFFNMMEIKPTDVFRRLALLLLKERTSASGYFRHLQRQDLISIIGAGREEKERHITGEIQDTMLQQASYSMADCIRANRALGSLDMLYDVLVILGRIFLLDVRVSNNGQSLKRLPFDRAIMMGSPFREFYIDLRDCRSIRNASLNTLVPVPPVLRADADDSSSSSSGINFSVSSSTSSDEESGTKRVTWAVEDKSFGDTIEGSAVKVLTKVEEHLSDTDSCTDRKPKKLPKLPCERVLKRHKGSGSDGNRKTIAKQFSPKKPTAAIKRPYVRVVKEDDSDPTGVKKKLKDTEAEILERSQNFLEILKKSEEWGKKLQKHVLAHVGECGMCPVHCYGVLKKKIKRESGRAIGTTKQKKSHEATNVFK